jgi:cerevisin
MLKPDVLPSIFQNHFNFLTTIHDADPLLVDDNVRSGIRNVYDGHIKGYSGMFTDGVIDQIRQMPEVDYIERDQIVKTMDVQKQAPWGLARISHRSKLTFGTFSKYVYHTYGGEGVDVYVVDTGINIKHEEFQGRASWGKTIPANDVDEDGHGHGTHCAGTIASRAYGVAKAANVIAVKVLGSNGSGTMSDVVSGVVWAAQQAVAKDAAARAEFAATGKTKHKGSVANMSLGGGKSRALDDAVNKAVAAGLHFAVAAGNDNRDACDFSPAGAEKAVTVGASTLADERAYFSNHGSCVDVFAPGLNIKSTWTGGGNATNTISGTSMASPHTAGLLAYLLSIYPSVEFDPLLGPDFLPPSLSMQSTSTGFASIYAVAHAALPSWVSDFLLPPRLLDVVDGVAPTGPPTLTPAQLKKALIALSTKDVLATLPDKTPNLLIFNNATA